MYRLQKIYLILSAHSYVSVFILDPESTKLILTQEAGRPGYCPLSFCADSSDGRFDVGPTTEDYLLGTNKQKCKAVGVLRSCQHNNMWWVW